jgi:putative phosphoribosyl transferase
VAAAVARELSAPLDVFVVRKLGLPAQPELAIGAIASGGARVLNDDVLRAARLSGDVVEEVTRREAAVLADREELYREGKPAQAIADRDVVIVDDGVATGATMRAAASAVRERGPRRLIVAVPVAPAETVADFRRAGIEIVALLQPEPFVAVGAWYRDFSATSDVEVVDALRRNPS